MKVLMFGWEFPPHFSGGLGVVCYELTKAMSEMGVETTYVMPFGPEGIDADYVNLKVAENLGSNLRVEAVESIISPYITEKQYKEEYEEIEEMEKVSKKVYSPTLFQEVDRFGEIGGKLAKVYDHDVIHAHDWLTYPAAIAAKKQSGKPMVVHVHATEFDRTGDGGVNQRVYDLERQGMQEADVVITVSKRIKQRCIEQYGIPEEKIEVVYNAVNLDPPLEHADSNIKKDDKIVLFVGRITLQKGPDYFVEAAKKVLEHDPKVKFIMAGTGDMMQQVIDKAASLGIGHKIIFPGFVNDVEELYSMADVFVMPSVSEPFGLVPLEAMVQETPAIISKQSGVSEVLDHVIKVDFWDTDKIAENILALLNYQKVNDSLKEHGSVEVMKFDWRRPAAEVIDIYNRLQVKA